MEEVRWRLRVSDTPMTPSEALTIVREAEAKGWMDYLILEGIEGFYLYRSFEEVLSDPEAADGRYKVFDNHGVRAVPDVDISLTNASWMGNKFYWDPRSRTTGIYYNGESMKAEILKFGFKNPLWIQCST